MSKIVWDQTGERLYETGVDHGVVYPMKSGAYQTGVAWNGLTAVNESPSGAEATAIYADNIKYVNLMSVEEFAYSIEAYTYPVEFGECDGTREVKPGIYAGQQKRIPFGFTYRSKLGNDEELEEHGYKLHLIYNSLAAPSEKGYSTISDSPDAITFSWECSTTPVAVNTEIDGETLRDVSTLVFDSTKVDATFLAALEEILYGSADAEPRLPLPDEVIELYETYAAAA